jgi:hypothetical protein
MGIPTTQGNSRRNGSGPTPIRIPLRKLADPITRWQALTSAFPLKSRRDWGPTLAQARPTLERLAARGVEPKILLNALRRIDLSLRLGSRRTRELMTNAATRRSDAIALDKAAQIVDRWRHVLEGRTPLVRWGTSERGGYGHMYPRGEILRWIAASLRKMPARSGRPKERHVLVAARVLEIVIRERTGSIQAADVGRLIHAAWPSDYQHSEGDEARAARKLLARARATISEGLALRVLGREPPTPLPPDC